MKKPQAKDFNTNDGLHAAMREWAYSQDKPRVEIWFKYEGDLSYYPLFVLYPLQKEVTYRCKEGEIYTVPVDVGNKYTHVAIPLHLEGKGSVEIAKYIVDRYSHKLAWKNVTLDPVLEDEASSRLPEGVKLLWTLLKN